MLAIHDLPLHQCLFKALDKLGFKRATAVQARAIPHALAGEDLLVSAQTGSGKTAAFLLPILQRLLTHDVGDTGTRALILLPTRELALQTQKHFGQLAAFTYLKSGLIIGGEAFKHQVATLRKNPEVIIATPGRLVDHIEKGTTDFNDLELLVIDEADRMLDMGFALAMHTITVSCNKQRQNLLFSATLNHKGLEDIKASFKKPQTIEVGSARQQHSQITQQIMLADNVKHKEKLVLALIEQQQPSKVFVFCNKRVQCEKLSNVLRYHKLKSAYIHGEIAQNDRKQILNSFRQGSTQILVATDLAARGLDIDDVDLVINFTIAQSGDDHVHRVGRTGRAGKTGLAVSLVSESEWNQMSSIERYLKIRFELRVISGLKADYSGPKKVKKSGKAVGPKKKKAAAKPAKSKASNNKKVSVPRTRTTESEPVAKSRTRVTGDGFAVLRKK